MGNSFSNSSERTTQPGHLCKLLSSSSQPPYLLLLGARDELDNSSPPAFRHAFDCSQVLPMCWHCFVTHVLISCRGKAMLAVRTALALPQKSADRPKDRMALSHSFFHT